MEESHPLYAQTSATAKYGIKPSQKEEQWIASEAKVQDLERQIPKNDHDDNSLLDDYTTKLVHEWNINDVSQWLPSIISPYFDKLQDDNTKDTCINNYILLFQEKNVNGAYLITNIESHQQLLTLCTEHAPINNLHTKEITKMIFKSIKILKKRAKKEINQMHPMKQSNLDLVLKEQYLKKKTFSFANKNNDSIAEDFSFYEQLMQITTNRYYRIALLSLMLLIFCLIESIDFIPNKDYGGIFAMVMFIVATCIIMCLLCSEKPDRYTTKSVALASQQKQGNFNVDTAHLLEADEAQRGQYSLSVGAFHILASICVLFGGMSFIVSRWMKMGAISMSEWFYGFGIGFYIGGLCVILVIDLAFVQLFDKHSRRMKCYHFMNCMYYLLVIGYFAIVDHDASIFLGIIVIISSFVSVVVMIIFSFPRLLQMCPDNLIKVILPLWIILIHIVTMIGLLVVYDWKFYPVCDEASVCGTIAFIVLSSTVALMLAIDSRIAKKTPWYKANL